MTPFHLFGCELLGFIVTRRCGSEKLRRTWDETRQSQHRRGECVIRTDNFCRRLSAARYADSLFSPHVCVCARERLKLQVQLSVCWCPGDRRAASQSPPLTPAQHLTGSPVKCSCCHNLTLRRGNFLVHWLLKLQVCFCYFWPELAQRFISRFDNRTGADQTGLR